MVFFPVSESVEFSSFYRVLNAVKLGEKDKQSDLDAMLLQYKNPENCKSYLHELGQLFISIGIKELYLYSGTEDLELIGNIEAEDWEEIAKEKKADLPPYLANTMIAYAKKTKVAETLAKKWSVTKREINKNIMPMARYICEGILDAIE